MVNKFRFTTLFIFLQLTLTDLRILCREFTSKFIDLVICLLLNMLIFGFVLPKMGLAPSYSSFIFVAIIVSFSFFELMGRVGSMISDMTGNQQIFYHLTLPMPSWAFFSQIAVSWALVSAFFTLLLFPLGKLLFFYNTPFDSFSIGHFLIILSIANLFFGFLGLWIVSFIRDASQLSMMWFRIITPMFMFGGHFYSWHSLYNISPILAIFDLINPYIYAMEGMRAAILGQSGYLPFYLSSTMLIAFTALIGYDAIRRLRRRLDTL